MARRIIGLDLGAYSVKLVRLETGKQHLKFEVVDAIEEVLAPKEPEGPDLLERQSEAIRKFAQAGLLENEGVAIALGSSEGQMRIMSVPFSEAHKIEAVLPGMIEAEIPFELSDMTYAWHRQEKSAKSAENNETLIRLAFGKKQSIAAMLHMLQPLGLDPRLMLLGSSALYELVRHIGYEAFSEHDSSNPKISALIDMGHEGTNICVFDEHGLIFTRSLLLGGKKLTEEIAQILEISFEEAQTLKHEKLNFLHHPADQTEQKIRDIALAHYLRLAEDISRVFIASESSNYGRIGTVALVGGASKPAGLDALYANNFENLGCKLISLKSLVPHKIIMPSMAMAYSLALSGIHAHAKDNRFNFRKDEFAWRGEFDFLRTRSTPLILWTLGIICSLTLMWSASSLVLDKENKAIESKLQAACSEILGKENIPARRCLVLMKEQISARSEVEIPEISAVDIYLKAAQGLPKDINVVLNEMDVSIATSDKEKGKVRVIAESASYADIDKVVSTWSRIPCFAKVENTGAQPVGGRVKYNISNDIDCQAKAQVPTTNAEAPKTSALDEPMSSDYAPEEG